MITDVDALYFEWLIALMEEPTEALARLGWMLHKRDFTRDVGRDENRRAQGIRLRSRFVSDIIHLDIDERKINQLQGYECSWLEMLIALSESMDYLYEGGVQGRFLELVDNLGLTKVLMSPLDGRYDEVDQELVDLVTDRVNNSRFQPNGHGGLFPLSTSNYEDQRGIEIWEQHAAYFREKLEGVVWTSIS